METITLYADISNLKTLQSFIENFNDNFISENSLKFNIQLIAEEIFVNISSYAYPQKSVDNNCTIEISYIEGVVTLIFKDRGVNFNPLNATVDKKSDIDLSNPGGLGIYMVKNLSKEVSYTRIDGENILKIVI